MTIVNTAFISITVCFHRAFDMTVDGDTGESFTY